MTSIQEKIIKPKLGLLRYFTTQNTMADFRTAAYTRFNRLKIDQISLEERALISSLVEQPTKIKP